MNYGMKCLNVTLPWLLAIPFLLLGVSVVEAQEGPVASLSPTSLDFGQTSVGTYSYLQTMMLNTGDAPLIISSFSLTDPFISYPTNTQDCLGYSMNPGSGCQLTIELISTTPGIFNGTFSIYDNAPDSPQIVPLTAKVTALKFSPPNMRFGT